MVSLECWHCSESFEYCCWLETPLDTALAAPGLNWACWGAPSVRVQRDVEYKEETEFCIQNLISYSYIVFRQSLQPISPGYTLAKQAQGSLGGYWDLQLNLSGRVKEENFKIKLLI